MIEQANRKLDCYPQTIFAPTQELLKRYYKFVPKIQPNLLGFTNDNFRENPQVSCISKKNKKEEVEKKLPNEYKLLFILKRL